MATESTDVLVITVTENIFEGAKFESAFVCFDLTDRGFRAVSRYSCVGQWERYKGFLFRLTYTIHRKLADV